MLYPQQWLTYPHETRLKLAELLKLPKTGHIHVTSRGEIISDGFTPEDLKNITVEKLQELTNSKTEDIVKLMEKLIKTL